jgi:hypothetical protein
MTDYEMFIEEQTGDLMVDIDRVLLIESFSDVEKYEYIEAYIKLKLNVVYTTGKIEGIDETRKKLNK